MKRTEVSGSETGFCGGLLVRFSPPPLVSPLPEGRKIETTKSRLKFSISLDMFNLDLENPPPKK